METPKLCSSCGRPLAPNAPQGLCPECLLKAGLPTEAQPAGEGQAKAPPPQPPTIEELARLLPQLEILELLGHGGMGAVYKARQRSLDRFVALKVLPARPASDTGFAERFSREARALARLSHHNIVAVYEFGQAGDLPYFLMEYVDGPNLRQLARTGKVDPHEALQIIPQICEALQFAHEEGIVHRDIKPENILLDKRGRVKIADFGIAKILGDAASASALTGARDVMGTPNYMAPEQVENPLVVDHRADIFSLGVVFYELLTGELPLGKFAPPSQKAEVDIRLDTVVLRALQKEPERRYQHAGELKTDLDRIASPPAAAPSTPPLPAHQPVPAAPPTPSVPGVSPSDRLLLPTLLLALFFGIFGAHRFYAGKIGTGLLLLFTGGGAGIWWLVDLILVACRAFKDKEGRRIIKWV
jgi:serine/threonine protein kinase